MRERPAQGGECPRTAIRSSGHCRTPARWPVSRGPARLRDSFWRRVIHAKVVECAADPRDRPGRTSWLPCPRHGRWPRTPAEITFWLDTTGGAEGAECRVENAVDPFNALGNGVTVNATLQANNWDATRHVACRRRRTRCHRDARVPRSRCSSPWRGRLVPLDEFAEQFGWNDRFAEGSLTWDGKRPALQHSGRNRNARSLLQQDAVRAEWLGAADDAAMS